MNFHMIFHEFCAEMPRAYRKNYELIYLVHLVHLVHWKNIEKWTEWADRKIKGREWKKSWFKV